MILRGAYGWSIGAIMRKNDLIAIFIGTLAVAHAADPQNWITEMRCGDHQLYISTLCSAAHEDFTLNTCQRPQILALTREAARQRKGQEIPAFSKQEKLIYQQAGTIKDLFATHWRCLETAQGVYFEIDATTGGGNAPHSEKSDFYTPTGRLLSETESNRIVLPYLKNKYPKMYYVKSLMPDSQH